MQVLLASEVRMEEVASLLATFRLQLVRIPEGEPIPGSYWGECEAGLVGDRLYWRGDTPVHSVLHEASHYICMDDGRRAGLSRDAGGDDAEESAVCYLQVLLAERIAGFGRERAWQDMDAWGYSFRLGSTRRWFETDAGDARAWLLREGIIDGQGGVTGYVRGRGRVPNP